MAELDHLVCVVGDLGAARREFEAAGFTAHDGGQHDGPTQNVLIPLTDCYIELLGMRPVLLRTAMRLLGRTPLLSPVLARRPPAERPFSEALARANGLALPVLRVDGLDAAVAALREAGFTVHDPVEMGRTTPSGHRLRWRQAVADDPDVPPLIEDVTDRGLRRPEATPQARALRRLVIPVHDLERAARAYGVLLPGSGSNWRAGDALVHLAPRTGAATMTAQLTGLPLPAELAVRGVSAQGPEDAAGPAAERLSEAVRFRTVSYEDRAQIEQEQFAGFGAFLERAYPRAHAELELRMAGHSRLYRWAGREEGRPAAILLAHQDVVPVDDLEGWTYPPFDGVIADGYVWGRGTIDDKSRVLATLEAVENALAAGFQPQRTVYLAFGHDEEIGGCDGAAKLAGMLAEDGVEADFLLDEGGVVTTGLVDGVSVPVASIMAGEKGFATVRLSTADLGGHPSMPPRQTAVGRLARAVAAVQDNPMPLRVTEPVREMVRQLAPYLRGPRRLLAAQAGKLGKGIAYAMTVRPETAALVRTTTAPTVFHGGVKANVLPQRAEALVNFRILHGDTIDGVLNHVRRVVKDDRINIELAPGMRAEPSPLSSTGSPAFRLLAEITGELLPEAAVTTGLVPGATDARHYHGVVAERFNFAPVVLDGTDLRRIHGTDERLSLANHARQIEFITRLLHRL